MGWGRGVSIETFEEKPEYSVICKSVICKSQWARVDVG